MFLVILKPAKFIVNIIVLRQCTASHFGTHPSIFLPFTFWTICKKWKLCCLSSLTCWLLSTWRKTNDSSVEAELRTPVSLTVYYNHLFIIFNFNQLHDFLFHRPSPIYEQTGSRLWQCHHHCQVAPPPFSGKPNMHSECWRWPHHWALQPSRVSQMLRFKHEYQINVTLLGLFTAFNLSLVGWRPQWCTDSPIQVFLQSVSSAPQATGTSQLREPSPFRSLWESLV